ncbi:MAG: zinc dependent phospholipase C family protein [Candidatus Sericytochromatia bacterium]
MPKEITHIVFADHTLKEIEKTKLHSYLLNSKDNYHFGALAVDSFYYNLEIPFIDKNFFQWGDLVHGAEGNNPFLPIYEALKEIKSIYSKSKEEEKYLSPIKKQIIKRYKKYNDVNQRISFICGYLTHCALDINFHPYVYYFSGNYYDPNKEESINVQMRHRIIEGWLDYYLIKENSDTYNTDSTFYAFRDDITNLKLLDFISYHFANTWYGEKSNIYNSLTRGYFIQKSLNSIFDNKKIKNSAKTLNTISKNKLRGYLALFYPDNFEIPDFIINFKSYKNPVTGDLYNSNFNDLWLQSLKLSKDFLEAVNEFIFNDNENILYDVIKGYSLDVGLIETNVKEVKYFSPWSLSV